MCLPYFSFRIAGKVTPLVSEDLSSPTSRSYVLLAQRPLAFDPGGPRGWSCPVFHWALAFPSQASSQAQGTHPQIRSWCLLSLSFQKRTFSSCFPMVGMRGQLIPTNWPVSIWIWLEFLKCVSFQKKCLQILHIGSCTVHFQWGESSH